MKIYDSKPNGLQSKPALYLKKVNQLTSKSRFKKDGFYYEIMEIKVSFNGGVNMDTDIPTPTPQSIVNCLKERGYEEV